MMRNSAGINSSKITVIPRVLKRTKTSVNVGYSGMCFNACCFFETDM